jgi:hypothetical protein
VLAAARAMEEEAQVRAEKATTRKQQRVEATQSPYWEEACVVAKMVMKQADVNRNNELSFTELTQMLENTAHEAFGRWVKQKKQKGFREYDADRQGTIGLQELEVA